MDAVNGLRGKQMRHYERFVGSSRLIVFNGRENKSICLMLWTCKILNDCKPLTWPPWLRESAECNRKAALRNKLLNQPPKVKLQQTNKEISQIYFANCNFCVSCKRISNNFPQHFIFINELFSLIKNHRCQHSFVG
jgi:hypothetical protein